MSYEKGHKPRPLWGEQKEWGIDEVDAESDDFTAFSDEPEEYELIGLMAVGL